MKIVDTHINKQTARFPHEVIVYIESDHAAPAWRRPGVAINVKLRGRTVRVFAVTYSFTQREAALATEAARMLQDWLTVAGPYQLTDE